MSEELNDAQIEEMRRKLDELNRELADLLQSTSDGVRPVDLGQPIGRLSRMDALQQQSMAQASRRNVEARLRQVRSALAAIESGDYGYCRRCEEPIAYRRLAVRPETPFCLDCQGRIEPQN